LLTNFISLFRRKGNMGEGYGTIPLEATRRPPSEAVGYRDILKFFTLGGLGLLVVILIVAIRPSAVVLDDEYRESQVVYPSESTENYPAGEWSGDTGAETSDQYPAESEAEPPGEWSGDTGAEPSEQYSEESTMEVPEGEWSGDTGAEPSDQYPQESTMDIPEGEWTGDTGSEPSDQYPQESTMEIPEGQLSGDPGPASSDQYPEQSLPDIPAGADVLPEDS
jgi:hypothetical protein